MKNNYVAYLESTVELQAIHIQQLESLIIIERAYQNTILGVRMGERWLSKHEKEIVSGIIKNGGLENAAVELIKSFRNNVSGHYINQKETLFES